MERKRDTLPDGPSKQLYDDFLQSYIMLVDEFHFPGHDVADKYCQENCNPTKYKDDPALVGGSACEENNRWAGMQKNIINSQTCDSATLYAHLLFVEHNDHVVVTRLRDDCAFRTARSAPPNAHRQIHTSCIN